MKHPFASAFRLLAFSAAWAFGAEASAQSQAMQTVEDLLAKADCSQRYRIAVKLYEEGRIDSALAVVRPCLESRTRLHLRTSRQTRADIHRLASEISYLLDDPERGRHYARRMLVFDPYYRPGPEDLSRFRTTLSTLYAMPRFSMGVKAEPMVTFVRVLDERSVFQGSDGQPLESGRYLETFVSYSAGFLSDLRLGKRLSLRGELLFSRQSFRHELDFDIPNTDSEVSTSYVQKMNYLQVPLFVRLNAFPYSTWRPYLAAGGYYQLLFQSTKESAASLVDVTEQMERHTFGLAGEVGLCVDFQSYALRFGARYYRLLGEANRPSRRFLNDRTSDVFVYQFYDAPDDVSFENLGFSVSVDYRLRYQVFNRK